MNFASRQTLPYWLILAAGAIAPFAFPAYSNELAVLWLMIVFASTWDILGGQMGYNSLGNIFFFGAGMYICAVVQIGLFYDVGMYTASSRTTHIVFSTAQYFSGFAVGTLAAGALVALVWNVQPFFGTTYSIRLFVIVTAAGIGNLPAVIAAGFGMGVFEQFGGFLLGAEFQQALIVLLLLSVLAYRQLQYMRIRQAVQ